MRALADQFATVRQRHPDDELMIVFDIDGTILDMRHMIRHVLVDYDRVHQTRHFVGLRIEDITVHENHVDRFLAELPMPEAERREILDWYRRQCWSSQAIVAAHRPYRGVMEVIRWFMLQPRTHVGIVTGRPQSIREDTLRSLNALGRQYRIHFSDHLLEMNRKGWEQGVTEHKAAALRRFIERGFRIFAAVDNEPENIAAMLEADEEGEILFLHADTIFVSRARAIPRTVSGKQYNLINLIPEHDIQQRVSLVWHGINDRGNLRQFLGSPVQWGECDVRCDPLQRLVLRHDSFEQTPWQRGENCPELDWLLAEIDRAGKSIKLDLKEGGGMIGWVLDCLARTELDDGRLWFNGDIGILREEGFRRLAAARPRAVIQCPVDFLAPMIAALPAEAERTLARLQDWGIGRFSIGWRTPNRHLLFEHMDQWGYEVNLYDVPDLESFLRAALMLPRSLTADFNFPAWQYYGRGSGQEHAYHDYRLYPAVLVGHGANPELRTAQSGRAGANR